MHFEFTIKHAALIFAFLVSMLFPSVAMSNGEVTLAWDPVTEPDIAGYRLYGREAGEPDYTYAEWEGTATHRTIEGLDRYESYYFVVRSFNYEGIESGNSNEVYLPSPFGINADNDISGNRGGCFIRSIS